MHIPQGQKGFSLVELLMVVLIIGLLASIAIPVYARARNNAYDSQAKSAIGIALIAARGIYIADGDQYNTWWASVYPAGVASPFRDESSLIQFPAYQYSPSSGWTASALAAADKNSDPKTVYILGWNSQILLCAKSKSGTTFCIIDSFITGDDPANATSWYVGMGSTYGSSGNVAGAWLDAVTNHKNKW